MHKRTETTTTTKDTEDNEQYEGEKWGEMIL